MGLGLIVAPMVVACASDQGATAMDAAASPRGAGDGGMSDTNEDASASEPDPTRTTDGGDEANRDPEDDPDGVDDEDAVVDDVRDAGADASGAHAETTTEAGLRAEDAGNGEVAATSDAATDPTGDAAPTLEDSGGVDTAPGCGDGVVGPGEACDEGADNADEAHCTTLCAWAVCGDGIVNGDEQCDDGNQDYDDDCVFECLFNVCGDGHVNPATEWCDDGNDDDFDSCPNDCSSETPCGDSFPPCAFPVCGDGIVDPGEACDDQNLNDEDSCRNDCTEPTPSDAGW